MAASKVTPEAVNKMIVHGRGLICVPLLSNQLTRLGISSMVPHNREAQRTDFTVSVDAAEGITTGISAYDRSSTIRILANPAGSPEELVQPGHVFPLRARSEEFLNGLVTPRQQWIWLLWPVCIQAESFVKFLRRTVAWPACPIFGN